LIFSGTEDLGYAAAQSLVKYKFDFNLTIKVGVRDLQHPMCKSLDELPVKIVHIDETSEESVSRGCADIDKILLVPPTDENFVNICSNFVDNLKLTKTKHIVLISVFGVQMEENVVAKQYRCLERYIELSGISFTFLRCSIFMEMFFKLEESIKQGLLRLPMENEKWAPVAMTDIAEAAASVLIKSSLENKVFDITGPNVLSGKEIADIISIVTGKKVEFKTVEDEEFKGELKRHNTPVWLASGVTDILEDYSKGFGEIASHDIESLTGKPALTFTDFVLLNADRFS